MTTTETTRLLGFTQEREGAQAWASYFGEHNTFDGEVPLDRVEQLMDYPLREARLTFQYEVEDDGGNPGGTMQGEIPDRKAIVRADTGKTLGIFKQGYQIHQPKEWLVKNLSNILDANLRIGAATLLKGGAVAIVQAEKPGTWEGAEGVRFRPYVSAATSHDGSLSTRYFTGTTIIACENQMGLIRDQSNGVSIRHSANSMMRLHEVRTRLDVLVAQVGDEMDQHIRKLTERYVTDQQFEDIVQSFTAEDKLRDKGGRAFTIAEKKANTLRELWANDDRVAPWRNNAWGVATAFNTASHHELSNKGNADKRFERNQMRAVDGSWSSFDGNVLRMLERV